MGLSRQSLALLLLFATSVARSGVPLVNLEEAAEVSSSTLTLPVSATGVAIFQPCNRCKLLSARASDKSRYFINEQQVTLEALRTAFSRGSTRAVVFYDERTMELTRIKAFVKSAGR